MAQGVNWRRDDLALMIAKMRKASDAFYRQAQSVVGEHHAFIEFAGLMNEYIDLCEAALGQGIDFTETSVHSGRATLPFEEHHRRYLSEKLMCIYGRSLEALLTPPAARSRQCCRCHAKDRVLSRYQPVTDPMFAQWVPIAWSCAACGQFVCFNCTLTKPGSVPLEFRDDTLCSEECAQALELGRSGQGPS